MKIPYIIAEIGINHNGNFALAKEMISEIKIPAIPPGSTHLVMTFV